MTIEVTEHAPPIVLGLAATLKRAAAHPRLAARLAKMKGVVALRSSVDAQSATIRFDGGDVLLSGGVADDADVTITLDWGDRAAKPKVAGAIRHPLLALGVAKVLEPPTGAWEEEAAAFWDFAKDTPRMPRSLLVVCTDDGGQAQFGETGPPEYEIHGAGDALASMFSGTSVFVEDFQSGKLQAVGRFEHASVLAGRAFAWTFGEGR